MQTETIDNEDYYDNFDELIDSEEEYYDEYYNIYENNNEIDISADADTQNHCVFDTAAECKSGWWDEE